MIRHRPTFILLPTFLALVVQFDVAARAQESASRTLPNDPFAIAHECGVRIDALTGDFSDLVVGDIPACTHRKDKLDRAVEACRAQCTEMAGLAAEPLTNEEAQKDLEQVADMFSKNWIKTQDKSSEYVHCIMIHAPTFRLSSRHFRRLAAGEKLARSDALVADMDEHRFIVRANLESARRQRDVVKTLCLNDKLNQLDVAIRSARERGMSMLGAMSSGDVDLVEHEFTIMTVLDQRGKQLHAEANQCVGSESDFPVSATIDLGLPSEDEFETSIGNVIIDPPSCVSCVK
jgi:hypothetical protein